MARQLNPIVGELNPNLYSAAKNAGLSLEEQNLVEQFSFTVKKAKELRGMQADKAKKQYRALSEDAQNAIKAIYPNAEFVKEDPTLTDRVFGAAKVGLKILGSPIIETYKVAERYGKSLNTPYSAIRQIAQGESATEGIKPLDIFKLKNPFAGSVWSKAYEGKELYDKGAIERLNERHGAENVLVAKGLLAGKTPGEIIQEYGKIDNKISSAIMEAFDNSKKFNSILEDVKYAQTSPGRDIVRSALEAKPTDKGGFLSKLIFGETPDPKMVKEYQKIIKKTSGSIDAIYQIAIDPLTYFTAGTTKVATKGAKIAENAARIAREGDYESAVKSIFAEPDVRNLWDGDLGNAFKRFAEAETPAEKSLIVREIMQNYPGFANEDTIRIFANAKTFDADSAERFALTDVNNIHIILNNRVDGVTYMRNGVATARNQRHISGGIAKTADAIFNPSSTNAVEAERIAKLQKEGMDNVAILKTVGEDVDQGVNVLGIAKFQEIDKDIKRARRIADIVGRAASRNPSGMRILLGADAIKSAEAVRLTARQVFSRDMADFITYEFLNSRVDEQVVMLRNLYAAIMSRYGLDGTVEGRKLKEEILNRTFNRHSGMTTIVDTEVPTEFASEVSEHILNIVNDVPFLRSRGVVHSSQLSDGIATLPHEKIIQVAAMTRRKNSIPALFDGATRNKYVSDFVNIWTILTLFPRLGIRSAIDEAFMYAFNAPMNDLFRMANPELIKEKAVLTSLTGSTATTGPFKAAINKLFRDGGAPKKLSDDVRRSIPEQIANDKGIPVEEVTNLMIREETVNRVFSMYGVDETMGNYRYIKDLFIDHPDVLSSMASSVAARTSISGALDKNVIDSVFTPSVISNAIDDIGVKVGRKFRSYSTTELQRVNDKYLTLAHFQSFFRMFVHNTRSLGDGAVVDPVNAFFRNNGLRTPKDFATARTQMLESIGVVYDWDTKTFVVKRPDIVSKFLREYGDSLYFSQRGLNEAEIARAHIETMLIDMRTTFHGGARAFNEELWSAFVARHNELVAREMETGNKIKGKWSLIAEKLKFEDFEGLTVKYHPTGEINTNLEFPELMPKAELEGMWAKFGSGLMEQMDRQVNGLFRQGAVLTGYTKLRESYEGFEKALYKQIYNEMLQSNPKMPIATIEKIAKGMARKRYVEIAVNESVDSVLKFVDNPAIRTNFAVSTRTVARFYRATEDFWRRYYRLMREKPLQVIYRMRLAHQGLSARGEVQYDEEDNPYLVMPTDTIINSAVEPVMRKLTGSAFKVPQFNDITLKLNLINPSFSPEAGQPGLSGPISALSFLSVRSILGYAPGPLKAPLDELMDKSDAILFGSIGDNMDLKKALIPLFLQNVRDTLPRKEQSRQEVSATFQAISYIQAFGGKDSQLPENPTDVQKAEFIKSVKIAAHNVVAMRAFLGMLSPISPTLREGKGVPNYIKRTGIVSLRSEFYDILAGVYATYGDEAGDPYELATAMFIGKNPRKTIYTVSRNERATKVIIQKTNEVMNWSRYNKDFIDTYGESAFVFAPQVGEYNAAAYTWLEANDLISSPSLEKYLDNVLVSTAKQEYFDIARQEEEALANEGSISARKTIIKDATNRRNALKNGNPLLRIAIETPGFEVATEESMLSSVSQALTDGSAPINKETKQKMAIAVKLVQEFISYSKNPDMRLVWNFTQAKREKRAAIENTLSDLIASDPSLREANRAIFSPILSFYSRDTYSAGGN